MKKKRFFLGCLCVCLLGGWNLQKVSVLSDEAKEEPMEAVEASTPETSGNAPKVSASEVDEETLEASAPAEKEQLLWLSGNQELWCDEVTLEAEEAGRYSVTDLDGDGYLEIAQNVDGCYYYYQEVREKEGAYSLEEAGVFDYTDYIMGFPVKDAENGWEPKSGFESEETVEERQDGTAFLPRSEAQWVLSRFWDEVPSDTQTGLQTGLLEKTSEIFFGSGLELRLSGSVSEDTLYQALEKSYQAFTACEEEIHMVEEQLLTIFQSEVYKEAVSGGVKSVAVMDLDGDGLLELYLSDEKRGYPEKVAREESGMIRRYQLTESGELIRTEWEEAWFPEAEGEEERTVLDMAWADLSDADEADSSRIGLAYMRYNVWSYVFGKRSVPETELLDDISYDSILGHYFGPVVEDEPQR